MRDPEEMNIEPLHAENDELVRRLRELQWPSVRPEVRERCWDAFNMRLAERLGSVEDEPRPRRNAARRLDFSRRRTAPNVPPALGTCGRRAWTARPTRRIAAFVA